MPHSAFFEFRYRNYQQRTDKKTFDESELTFKKNNSIPSKKDISSSVGRIRKWVYRAQTKDGVNIFWYFNCLCGELTAKCTFSGEIYMIFFLQMSIQFTTGVYGFTEFIFICVRFVFWKQSNAKPNKPNKHPNEFKERMKDTKAAFRFILFSCDWVLFVVCRVGCFCQFSNQPSLWTVPQSHVFHVFTG